MNVRNWMLVPGLALVAAGCADSITAPEAPLAPAGAAFSSHVSQSGNNGHAYHGYLAPEVAWNVTGNAVEVCADWTDHESIAAFLEGRGTTADDIEDYKFAVTLSAEDVSHETEIVVRDFSERTGGCATLFGIDDGEYELTVKGKVQMKIGSPPNQETTNHHTVEWVDSVTVGSSFRFRIELVEDDARLQSVSFGNSNGTWNQRFLVQTWSGSGWSDVTDCSVFEDWTFGWDEGHDVTATATIPEGAVDSGKLKRNNGELECGIGAAGSVVGAAILELQIQRTGANGTGSSFTACTDGGSFGFLINDVAQENDPRFTVRVNEQQCGREDAGSDATSRGQSRR